MSEYNEEIENLDSNADGLSESLSQASVMVTGFDSELRRMRESLAATGKDVANLIIEFIEREARPKRTRTRGKG